MNPSSFGRTVRKMRALRLQSLRLTRLAVLAMGLALTGCPNPELKELNPCLVSGVVERINVTNVDKVDMLFMVDNSHSMADLQAALEVQLPNLIRVLTTGRRDPNSTVQDFQPATDLHLGVISSDMGLVNIPDIPGCGIGPRSRTNDHRGDDGRLIYETRHIETKTGCQGSYNPRFLQFQAGQDTDQVAHDFACLAMLGTDGCGFEQQLEAPLKALAYPNMQADVLGDNGNYASNAPDGIEEVSFIGPERSEWGHGHGANAGFLRDDSLLAIVQVTDEEDCSAWNLDHFHHPNNILERTDINPAPDHPHRNALNLRCFYNKDNLYPVKRYINGARALRPEAESLIVYAAIVGVPQELITLQPENWRDDGAREAWYDTVLNDPSMTESIDPNSDPLNLNSSCRTISGVEGVAYPPLRIVETVRGFGANGVVQSICQDDFGPALEEIIRAISDALGAVCLHRKIPPTAEGVVNCEMVWELPTTKDNPSTITHCSEAAYLTPPDDGRPLIGPRGGEVCVVHQLSVDRSGDVPVLRQPNNEQGWYYDDFSSQVQDSCEATPQRIALTDAISPGTGVVVSLECLNEQQTLPDLQASRPVGFPEVGDGCRNDQECEPTTVNDAPLICHSEANRCVIGCEVSANCPPGWVCDARNPDLRPFCVNPTCGDD